MATCKKVSTQIIYELTLTAEEAGALLRVTSYIGGCPYNSARKHIESIAKALNKDDVEPIGEIAAARSCGAGLYFMDGI